MLIVAFNHEDDDYGVYGRGRGEFNTPLLFRGTLIDCLTYRQENDV